MTDDRTPCTRRHKLTPAQRKRAMDAGLCCNGCEKPIAPPSRVVCRDYLDQMGGALEALLLRMEGG